MNPVIKIINQILIIINRLIDNLDRKTTETIKSTFYFVIFILIIVGIFIGYNKGKNAAKIHSKPLNESTNNVFDVTIKKSYNKGRFRSMLESELLEETKEIQLKKVEFPANEKLLPEQTDKIIETESENKNIPPGYLENEKLAEIDRLNEKLKSPDVHRLEKENQNIKSGKNNNELRPIINEPEVIE